MKLRVKKPVVCVAIGYIRMSTSKQDLSPAAQGEAIERWAARTGAQLAAVYFDYGVSGAAELPERPGLTAAIAGLSGAQASTLVAAKLDRFARDSYVMGAIDREVRRVRAGLVSADGATDDELRRDFDVLMSAHERRLIRQRTRAALAVKKARNERTGSVPYGMQLAADGVHLEANAAEQTAILRAKALSDEGLSVRAIAAKLAAEGVTGRTGNALSHTQVHRILRPLLLALTA